MKSNDTVPGSPEPVHLSLLTAIGNILMPFPVTIRIIEPKNLNHHQVQTDNPLIKNGGKSKTWSPSDFKEKRMPTALVSTPKLCTGATRQDELVLRFNCGVEETSEKPFSIPDILRQTEDRPTRAQNMPRRAPPRHSGQCGGGHFASSRPKTYTQTSLWTCCFRLMVLLVIGPC